MEKAITYFVVWLFMMAAIYSVSVLFCAFITWSAPEWLISEWGPVARTLFLLAAVFWAICAWKAAVEE